jgi:hypothetical protein
MAKKALLMGLNRYRVPGADLRGCVNDVLDLGTVLEGVFGFEPSDITTLIDYDATKAAMQREMEAFVRGAAAEDTLFLHYSGHGSNVPDKDGDEADHRDEILCPTDLDWEDPLTDDWIRDLFDEMPEGTKLTVIMDCCHSGTVTRRIEPPGPSESIDRFLPCPLDLVAVEAGRTLRGDIQSLRKAKKREAVASDIVDVDIPEVLITGCRDTQTSADAFIDGDYHGALTYSLVTAMRQVGGTITYRDLHDRATELLAGGGYSQVPQLEGRASRLERAFLE